MEKKFFGLFKTEKELSKQVFWKIFSIFQNIYSEMLFYFEITIPKVFLDLDYKKNQNKYFERYFLTEYF